MTRRRNVPMSQYASAYGALYWVKRHAAVAKSHFRSATGFFGNNIYFNPDFCFLSMGVRITHCVDHVRSLIVNLCMHAWPQIHRALLQVGAACWPPWRPCGNHDSADKGASRPLLPHILAPGGPPPTPARAHALSSLAPSDVISREDPSFAA